MILTNNWQALAWIFSIQMFTMLYYALPCPFSDINKRLLKMMFLKMKRAISETLSLENPLTLAHGILMSMSKVNSELTRMRFLVPLHTFKLKKYWILNFGFLFKEKWPRRGYLKKKKVNGLKTQPSPTFCKK